MGKIYIGQEDVEITLDSKIPLGSPDILKIAYKKPDGATGSFPSEGNAEVVETTKAQYSTVEDDLDVGNMWIFQIYTELPGGFKGYGEELEVWIYTPQAA